MLTPSELYVALRGMLKFTDSDIKIPVVDRPYYMYGKGDLEKDFFISAPCNDANIDTEDFKKSGNLDVISALNNMLSNEVLSKKFEDQHGVNIIIPLVECRDYGIQRAHSVFLYMRVDSRDCQLTLYDPKPLVSRVAYDIAPVAREAAITTMRFLGEYYKRAEAYVKDEEYLPSVENNQEEKYISPIEKVKDFMENKGYRTLFQKKCLGTQALTDNYSCGDFVYNYICSLVLASRLPESLSVEEVQGAYALPSRPIKPQITRGSSCDGFVNEDGNIIDDADNKWQTRLAAEQRNRSHDASPDLS